MAAARKSKVKVKKHEDKQGRNESLDRQEWTSVSRRYLETPIQKCNAVKREKQKPRSLTFSFLLWLTQSSAELRMSWDRAKT